MHETKMKNKIMWIFNCFFVALHALLYTCNGNGFDLSVWIVGFQFEGIARYWCISLLYMLMNAWIYGLVIRLEWNTWVIIGLICMLCLMHVVVMSSMETNELDLGFYISHKWEIY